MSHLRMSKRGITRRLLQDQAGNTLAIVAAATLPMMAIIGGGVDISRAYMTKTELQAACDAGVLAGRRAMALSGEYEEDERATAAQMFNFNFTGSSVQARDIDFQTDDNDDGEVTGTAAATMPTVIMKIFGKQTIALEVDCMAELQIGNADIMFVLDTTGSMGDSISSGQPSKINGLRDAVRDFHRTINQAVNDNRTRIRYGFVPYSMTVNARDLLINDQMPYEYFTDTTDYQSRLAVFNTKVYEIDEVEDLGTTQETYSSNISESNCKKYGNNKYPNNGSNPSTSGTSPNPVTTTEYDFYSWTKARNSNNGVCIRTAWKKRTTYEFTGRYKFTTWRYTRVPIDTSELKRFAEIPIATDVTAATVDTAGAYELPLLAQMNNHDAPNGVKAYDVGVNSYSWDGCIEERNTVAETNFSPIPDEAHDLNIDDEPEDDASRWKPRWNRVEFTRSNSGSNYISEDTTTTRSNVSGSCPSPMMLFRTVELSDDSNDIPGWLETYLTNLVAAGNTYHDIGMIWGARLTSPTGLFKDNVNLDADKITVSKHIIFMTDGKMEPTASGYSAYGIENLDSRIAPRGEANTITSRHNARFVAMCNAIKSQGTTIWVVAFGTSMTTELQNCATSGRAYYSSNPEALRSRFRFIAAQVADLRLGR